MQTLNVELGSRSYPIHIGEDLYFQKDILQKHIHGNQAIIISNDTVAPLYLEKLSEKLNFIDSKSIVLPDGEQYKTIASLEIIFDQLLKNKCARDVTLIALGGGVIGDITGFAAACYQRGVNFIQIPTTLLAQVDSSVGGKTGVNHPLGKNMIGAFYQPQCVIADIHTLHTLPARELSAGIAEVIKYGLLGDFEFYEWLQSNIENLLQLDNDSIEYAIKRSCECKAEIVASDEQEKTGLRALLNLGHTFGHAIETGMGYGTWLHGEAVACGMVVAAEFSQRLGKLTNTDVDSIKQLISAANLPIHLPEGLSADKMLELMSIDKKVLNGKLNLILLNKIGQAELSGDYDRTLLYETLKELTSD